MSDDLHEIETEARPWEAYDSTVAATGFFAMLRYLPRLCGQVLRLAWSTSRVDTAALIGLTAVAEALTGVGLLATNSVFEGLLIDGPSPERVRAALPGLTLLVVSVVIRGVLRQGAHWAQARLSPQLQRAVETRMLGLVTQVELVAFDDGTFHDRLHRCRQRAGGTVYSLLRIAVDLLGCVAGFAAIAGALTVLHPILLPLLVLAVIPSAWAAVRSARLYYQMVIGFSGANRRMETLGDLMTERSSAAEVRSYTMRPFLLGEWERLSRHVQAADLAIEKRRATAQAAGSALAAVGTAVIFAALGLLLYTGRMPLAAAGTAVIAIRAAINVLTQATQVINYGYENGLFYQDYLDLCAEAEQRRMRDGGVEPPADLDRISVRDVTFTYPGAEEPALNGVSLEIASGEIIALVGENGSGKTTLAKVIAGLYEPASGDVTYGGVSARLIDLDGLRGHTAVIAQNFTRWPFTARQNITIGRFDHPDAVGQFERAASASGAAEVFARLSKGAETLLDPSYKGGTELSGGQWQRIAVARGLFRDAPLLICDEPTASLDAKTEHAIFESIRRHAVQRTVVLITHRLASVRYADRIFVLDGGRVVEQGTHAELMALAGIYAQFYSLQASAYQEVSPL
ncbi:ATP-binding cassette subfamily B protein/ATP-binding cassette subfamily C protein [Allocatelliglobosispora scoriae]|uniref:ATP-binding cassette subfamily B protein/ATP-binding cassette subfamily C protein n=1 Tax=Allocatelliglobosispora scoriae TaxID=643052 RepID=A0A841BIR4_9ACTN|nr:ABC transporter ATP-binding protein [Allocatelliglobosispora scoriae]MBB5868154.1 ATP-binding cassette subfamily B protein/ATP-binding cassette subfamily C protein [Allocatelliglobosispora scoriae]